MTLSSDYIKQLHKPKPTKVFADSSNDWLAFRTVRYDLAGDCEYVVLRDLDLSGCKLPDFKMSWLAFVNCKLDGASFWGAEFIQTAFINCSMQNADFSQTIATGALFSGCDLTGAYFSPTKPYARWASIDLDDKIVPSFFDDCVMDDSTAKFLKLSGCKFGNDDDLSPAQRLAISGEMCSRMRAILLAPIADL